MCVCVWARCVCVCVCVCASVWVWRVCVCVCVVREFICKSFILTGKTKEDLWSLADSDSINSFSGHQNHISQSRCEKKTAGWEQDETQRGDETQLLTVAVWNTDWLGVFRESGSGRLQHREIQQQGLRPHVWVLPLRSITSELQPAETHTYTHLIRYL